MKNQSALLCTSNCPQTMQADLTPTHPPLLSLFYIYVSSLLFFFFFFFFVQVLSTTPSPSPKKQRQTKLDIMWKKKTFKPNFAFQKTKATADQQIRQITVYKTKLQLKKKREKKECRKFGLQIHSILQSKKKKASSSAYQYSINSRHRMQERQQSLSNN